MADGLNLGYVIGSFFDDESKYGNSRRLTRTYSSPSVRAEYREKADKYTSDAALKITLVQAFSIAQQLIELSNANPENQEFYLYASLYKQKLSELRMYAGSSDEGYDYIEQVADNCGVPFTVIREGAALIRSAYASEPQTIQEELNPSSTDTMPVLPKDGASRVLGTKSNGPVQFSYSATYDAKSKRWKENTTASVTRPGYTSKFSAGGVPLRKSLGKSKFAKAAAPTTPKAQSKTTTVKEQGIPVVDRSAPPSEEAAPAVGADRVDVQISKNKQDAIDEVLKLSKELSNPKLKFSQKLEKVARMQSLMNGEGVVDAGGAEVSNAIATTAASYARNPEGPVDTSAVANALSANFQNEILYSLSHKNKDQADEYLPQIIEAAAKKAGAEAPAKLAGDVKKTIDSLGIPADKAIDLLYRINSTTLTPDQQKALSTQLKEGKGFAAFMQFYPDQIKSFIKENPEIQDNIVGYLAKPENEEMAKKMLPYLQDAAIEKLGLGETGGGFLKSFIGGIQDFFNVPAHGIVGMFKAGKDFMKEFSKIKLEYYDTSPMQNQISEHYLYSTKMAAEDPIRKVQYEAGSRNLKSLLGGIVKDDAVLEGISKIMNSQYARYGMQAIRGKLQELLGGDERAASIMDLIEKNFKGLFSGYQGDYITVYESAMRNVHDRRTLEQFGIMASQLSTVQPGIDNNFKRAENYQAAIAGMMSEGFRPEYATIHGEDDMYRKISRLTEGDKDWIRRSYTSKVLSKIPDAWMAMNENQQAAQIDRIKKDAEFKEYLKEKGTPNLEGLDLYSTYKEYLANKEANEVIGAFTNDPSQTAANLQKIKNPLKDDLMNYVGASNIRQTIEKRTDIEKQFNDVLVGINDPTGFLSKLPGDKHMKARQLIRLLGGSDVTMNYEDQAARAMETINYATAAGMNLERAVSMVSESGKQAQALGLGPGATQASGNLAAMMTANIMARPRTESDMFIDENKVQAAMSRNAANIMNSTSSRNIMFLMNNDLKKGANATLVTAKEKLMKGEKLTDAEMAAVNNVDLLRDNYAGTAAEFAANRDNKVYSYQLEKMTSAEARAIQLNATEIEQKNLMERLKGDGYRSLWKDTVGSSAFNTLGSNADDMYNLRLDLLRKVGNKRANELMAGKGALTDAEKKILGEDTVARLKQLKESTKNMSDSDRQALINKFELGGVALAGALNTDIETLQQTLAPVDEGAANRFATTLSLSKKMGLNDGVALEKFVNSDESYGIRMAILAKDIMGAGVAKSGAEVAELLSRDDNGIVALLDKYRRNSSAEGMFTTLTGKEGKDSEAVWNQWAEAMGYKDYKEAYSKLYDADEATIREAVQKMRERDEKSDNNANKLLYGIDEQIGALRKDKTLEAKVEAAASQPTDKPQESTAPSEAVAGVSAPAQKQYRTNGNDQLEVVVVNSEVFNQKSTTPEVPKGNTSNT